MALVSLELFKQHIHADAYDGDDMVMLQTLEAAEECIALYLNGGFEESLLRNGGYLPRCLTQAILMLAAHFYRHPEPVEEKQHYEIPYTIDCLLKPYKKLGCVAED